MQTEINKNKEENKSLYDNLYGDMQNTTIYDLLDVKTNLGLTKYDVPIMSMAYDGVGTWKYKLAKIQDLIKGTYYFIVYDANLPSKGFIQIESDININYITQQIYKDDFGKIIKFNFDGTDEHPNDFQIRMQISIDVPSDAGEYYAKCKLYHVENPDNTIFTTDQLGISHLESDVSTIKLNLNNVLRTYPGKNLFDKTRDDITDNCFINKNGAPTTNQWSSAYSASGFIGVKPNTAYSLSPKNTSNTYIAFYDSDTNFICSYMYQELKGSENIVSPDNAAYCRFSYFTKRIDSVQFESGFVSTDYEEYTVIDESQIAKNKYDIEDIKKVLPVGIKAVIPSNLYVCINHSLPLYFENIIYKSLKDDGDLRFNLGTRTNRLQKMLFTEIGSQQLTMYINKNLKNIWQKTINLIQVNGNSNNEKVINLLCIGDSFTDIGSYVKEIKSLLEADGANVKLIGTCGNGSFLAEGLSGGRITNSFIDSSAGVARIVSVTGVTNAPSTGYPGQKYKDANGVEWTIRSSKIDSDGNGKMAVTKLGGCKDTDFTNFPESGVLTKTSTGVGDSAITYSNPVKAYFNPFIDPDSGELDISTYLTRWEQDTPNVIVIQFTMNDIQPTATDATLQTVVNNYIIGIDHIHDKLPDAKIIISVEPYGAINKSYDWNLRKERVLTWVELLINTFESDTYSDYVKIAPSYACVDLINGYSSSKITPSDRYSAITEPASGDGVHPSTGMLEIADCIYPVITYMINN